MVRLLAAFLLAAGLAGRCLAEDPPDPPPPGSDWSVEAPQPGEPVPQPPDPPSTGTPSGFFSWAEQFAFFQDLNRDVLDQACRNLPLNVGQNRSLSGVGGAGGRLRRWLGILPGSRVAIVDEQDLSADLGGSFPLAKAGDLGAGLSLSARVEGASMVVRTTPSTNSCSEIGRLLSVTDVKTIFPFTAERLGAMELGELWKLPVRMSIGVSGGPGAPAGPYGSFSVSLGYGRRGSATMTVYRMAPEKLRFRMRLDHAQLYSHGAQLAGSWPVASVLGIAGSSLWDRLLEEQDRQLASQVTDFLSAALGAYASRSDGQQIIIEFLLDPRDPEVMGRLARLMRGDLRVLARAGRRMLTSNDQAVASVRDDIRTLDLDRSALGKEPEYPAIDLYHDRANSFTLNLPLLVKHHGASTQADDHIQRLDDEGGQFRISQAEEISNSDILSTPLGTLFKHNTRDSAQAFVYTDKEGRTSAPQAVYIAQEGFLRRSSGDVRRMLTDVDDVMTLAGARGLGRRESARLPVDLDKEAPANPPEPSDPFAPSRRLQYHDGALALTLVFTEQAVRQILEAPAELVLRCYRNILDAQKANAFNWMLINGRWEDGRLKYSAGRLRRDLGLETADFDWPGRLAHAAAGLAQDLEAARTAPDPQTQVHALTELMSGKGRSGLDGRDVVKVLIQLVDPSKLAGDMVVNVAKGLKGRDDFHAHFVYNKAGPPDALLRKAAEAKARFGVSSPLLD